MTGQTTTILNFREAMPQYNLLTTEAYATTLSPCFFLLKATFAAKAVLKFLAATL